MDIPRKYEQVLAEIRHIHDHGISRWREVILHDGDRWQSFAGSKTFEDGEQVIAWDYAESIELPHK